MRQIERVVAGCTLIASCIFCTETYAGILGSTMNQTWHYERNGAPESSNDGDRVLGVDFENSAVPGTTWQAGAGFYTSVSDWTITFESNIQGQFFSPINLLTWSDVGDTLPNITNVQLQNTSTWEAHASALPALSFNANSITMDVADIYLYDSPVWKSIEIVITLEGNAVPGLPAVALLPGVVLISRRRRR